MGSDYFPSPTLFYPRPQPLSFSYNGNGAAFQSSQGQWRSMPPSRPQAVTNPSRKRSRDELDDGSSVAGSGGSLPSADAAVHGQGMALAAEGRNGTWCGDRPEAGPVAAATRAAEQEARGRPKKALRLDSLPMPPSDIATPPQTPAFTTPAPTVDVVSMMLGVGWRTISPDADMQSAARGWARYIDKHFPSLQGVEMLLKSDGQEAFVVRATEGMRQGYYLFRDDLSEGRLIARDWDRCASSLRRADTVFEGPMMTAQEGTAQWTPAPSVEPAGMDMD